MTTEVFRRELEKELAEILVDLSEGLRGGETLLLGFRRLAQGKQGIWPALFREVLARYEEGQPLVMAFQGLERLDSSPVRLMARAIQVHQRTGGNLADVLARLAETVREASLARGEIQARTVEARWTVYLLAGVPFLFASYFFLQAPDLLQPLLTERAGRLGLAYAGLSWAAGWLIVRRLLCFDTLSAPLHLWRKGRQQQALAAQTPFLMDLMTVAADGGMNLHQALEVVAEHLPGPLGLECRRVRREITQGGSVPRSFEDLAERVQVDELRSFARILRLGHTLGTPTAAILRQSAQVIRRRQKQRLEERLGVLPILINLCALLFFFPPVMILLLLPNVLNFLRTGW